MTSTLAKTEPSKMANVACPSDARLEEMKGYPNVVLKLYEGLPRSPIFVNTFIIVSEKVSQFSL